MVSLTHTRQWDMTLSNVATNELERETSKQAQVALSTMVQIEFSVFQPIRKMNLKFSQYFFNLMLCQANYPEETSPFSTPCNADGRNPRRRPVCPSRGV